MTKTAFLTCRNILGNPEYEGIECPTSFLDCFGCPCSYVEDANIPTLMRLVEEMVERFDRMTFDDWVERFGEAWTAITTDILPSKTPEELAEFAELMPSSTPLTVLEFTA